jgi:hypothetical protein
MDKDYATAATILGLSVANAVTTFRDTAPPLKDLRLSHEHDFTMRQLILDADITTGITILLYGGTVWVMTGKPGPLLLSSVALLLITVWYRSVLSSASPTGGQVQEEGQGE